MKFLKIIVFLCFFTSTLSIARDINFNIQDRDTVEISLDALTIGESLTPISAADIGPFSFQRTPFYQIKVEFIIPTLQSVSPGVILETLHAKIRPDEPFSETISVSGERLKALVEENGGLFTSSIIVKVYIHGANSKLDYIASEVFLPSEYYHANGRLELSRTNSLITRRFISDFSHRSSILMSAELKR